MNCNDIDQHIDDYLDRRLDENMHSEFEQHLENCTDCSAKVAQMSTLLTELQNLPVAYPSADFEQRVFAEVRRRYPLRSQDRFVAGFVTALAASLAVWAASTLYMSKQISESETFIAVELNQTRTLRLMFDAQSDIESVSLSVQLPNNMQLAGYPGQRTLNWQTQLKKGANVLALPVMAIGPGEGELVAQLSYRDRKKTVRVVLKTGKDGVMRYELRDMQSV